MNQEHTLQQVLEQATAVKITPAQGQDPEVALLRAAWLAFGQLLDSAEPREGLPLVLPALSPARRWRWPRAVLGALAISLFVGIMVAWGLHGASQPANPPPVAPDLAVTTVQPAATAIVPAPTPPGRELLAKDRSAAGNLKWDDSLDDEITLASQNVIRVQQSWSHRADAVDLLKDGLQEVVAEVEGNSL
jgi:hypothetical protein